MKRHPRLRPLSDDHHGALVLARRARRAAERAGANADALAKTWQDVTARFATELEPHFRVEEAWLFPELAAAGDSALAERALADHARLRGLVRAEASAETALAFAATLETHVRFEERELFPRMEALLAKAAATADTDPRRLAEAVRAACIAAALEGYEDAALRGLCHEGAFEAAVSAMRMVPLDEVTAPVVGRSRAPKA